MLQNFIFIFIFISVTALFAEEYTEENSYQLGEGAQVASLPLYVGGYFSLNYRYKDGDNRYQLDDIALLGYGEYNRFSYMAEFEFKEFYTLYEEESGFETRQDKALHTERLYVDYNVDENYMVRLGKYNSQVGFWNLLPINVLRETSSNPITTEIVFPKFTTGAYATYSSFDEYELKIDIMLQHNDDFDVTYNNYVVDEHYGVGVTFTKDNLDLKLNIGMFDSLLPNNTNQNLYYMLGSFKYETQDFQCKGELGTQRSAEAFTTAYAGYLQGLYYLNEKNAAIVRFESYDDKFNHKRDDMAILGYTYRPLYPVALKTEYQFHGVTQDDRFIFSFSVLF